MISKIKEMAQKVWNIIKKAAEKLTENLVTVVTYVTVNKISNIILFTARKAILKF